MVFTLFHSYFFFLGLLPKLLYLCSTLTITRYFDYSLLTLTILSSILKIIAIAHRHSRSLIHFELQTNINQHLTSNYNPSKSFIYFQYQSFQEIQESTLFGSFEFNLYHQASHLTIAYHLSPELKYFIR